MSAPPVYLKDHEKQARRLEQMFKLRTNEMLTKGQAALHLNMSESMFHKITHSKYPHQWAPQILLLPTFYIAMKSKTSKPVKMYRATDVKQLARELGVL